MHPRFSVVVPVRDRAEVVGRAVASVLAQTFADLEVVVVDDGSTDQSVAAARSVADERVRIVRQDATGTGTARTSGVQRSTGRWVLVLDPDDEVDPGWLARIGRLIDGSGAHLVSCGGEHHHQDGSITVAAPSVVRTAADGTRQYACFRPGAFAVPRELLVSVGCFGGPDDERSVSVVGDLLLDAIGEQGRTVVATPEPLVRWNEATAGDAPRGDDLRLHWALQSLDALARTPIPDADQLTRSATVGGITAVRLGDHREARRLFRLARRVQPEVPRHWARWFVACVPPIASRVWAADPQGDLAEDGSDGSGAGSGNEPLHDAGHLRPDPPRVTVLR